MSAVILDATNNGSDLSKILLSKLGERNIECACFRLEEMNILPCRSCGACGFKSPGKCVLKDDIHDIMRAVARGSLIFMLTPIRFGGYSSTLKKVLDRMMGVCLPGYIVKDGRLLHPARYGSKTLLGIGIYRGKPDEQVRCFEKLVEHNAVNMQYGYKTLLLEDGGDFNGIGSRLDGLLREAAL